MPTTEIRPALSAEEWARFQDADRRSWVVIAGEEGEYHQAAATALYDQPFGFERSDVQGLRWVAELARSGYGACGPEGGLDRYRDHKTAQWADGLADRIAALLPP